MARRTQEQEERERISRKEYLLQRRKQEERRKALIVVAIVAGLLSLVLLAGVIIEGVVAPNRAVATVSGEEIALGDWQDRVEYQRASLILLLEDQLEAFTDVGAPDPAQAETEALRFVQQFLGQQIVALTQQPEALGEFVLERMIEDVLIRQEAEERGIVVTEADVDEQLAEQFNYFGGQPPTPPPTPTETVQPTPSITPISSEVITITATPLPTLAPGPTNTPLPTATAVSAEAFEDLRSEELARYRALGVSETTFREALRAELYRERLQEDLADAVELSDEAEHYSFYTISTDSRESAEAVQDLIQDEGYLTVWNQLRSGVLDPADEEDPLAGAQASEVIWRTVGELQERFGDEVVEAMQLLPIGVPSDVLVTGDEETGLTMQGSPIEFFIVQVSGREERPLTQAALDNREATLLEEWLDESRLAETIERTEFWRGRVPRQPLLDPKFTRPLPTPTTLPVQPENQPLLPVEPTDGEGDAPASTPPGDAGP